MPESALERKLSVFKPKRKKMTFNQLSSLISKDDLFNPKTKDSIIKDVREKIHNICQTIQKQDDDFEDKIAGDEFFEFLKVDENEEKNLIDMEGADEFSVSFEDSLEKSIKKNESVVKDLAMKNENTCLLGLSSLLGQSEEQRKEEIQKLLLLQN